MNLLSIDDLSEHQISHIFDITEQLQLQKGYNNLLRGKTLILFFPETSIRTRLTCTLFAKSKRIIGSLSILMSDHQVTSVKLGPAQPAC